MWDKTLTWLGFDPGTPAQQRIVKLIKQIMATQAEITQQLRDALASMQKTQAEIKSIQDNSTVLQQKIADLQAIIDAGGTIGQDLIDAAAAVKTQAQVLDDEIPDAPVPPPTP